VKITALKPTTEVGYGVAVLGCALVLLAAPPTPAGAAPAPPVCKTSVAAKGKRWTYQGSGVTCKFMAQSTKRFLRRKLEPDGWTCTRVRTRGLCQEDGKGGAVFVFSVKTKR
jgi:hypothetical protein